MVQARWTQLGKDKLGSSGLTTKQADKMGMYEVASAKLVHPHLEARPALIIPYYDIKGDRAQAHPYWPDFFRARYLDKGTGFAAMATEKGDQRYAQPPRTGVCAYFPKLIDWKEIATDTSIPIIITEGELKAGKGCDVGWATIGLGGVWNFRASSEGFFFLPELEKIDWARRQVYVAYDSDYRTKQAVCFAINSLAEELLERGAIPFVTTLPDVYEDDRKTGLDDYLLQAKEGDFERLLEESQPITMARALWKLNREVVYVRNPGMVIKVSDGLKMTPGAFKEHSEYSTESTSERKVTANGDIVTKKVAAAPMWIKWPMRRTVNKVTYAPGKPRITDDMYNQWEGWGVTPKRGNVKPFLDLLKFLFKDMEPSALTWFLDWLAYPIQNPGAKMFSAVVVWGPAEGTGKSLVGYTMGEIYGKNFKELTDSDLEGDYTAWAENRQFVMGDEITGNDNRQFANRLKRLITQRSVTVNVKFVPQYEVPDCINYYFTSNHADAFFMSDKDRRFMIVEVQGDPLDQKFYDVYDKWLWYDGGPAHLMQWLLDYKISKDFNPNAKPPRTAAKERMIRSGKGELSGWISDLLEHPSQVLVTGKLRHTRDLWTASELLSFYRAQHPDAKATAIGLGKQLSNAGVPQADGGQPLRAPDGTQGRYFIIRNVERWKKCRDRKKLEAHLKSAPVPRVGVEKGKV